MTYSDEANKSVIRLDMLSVLGNEKTGTAAINETENSVKQYPILTSRGQITEATGRKWQNKWPS